MIGHRALSALVDRTQYTEHIVRTNVPRKMIVAKNVGCLIQVCFRIGPRRLVETLEILDVRFKEVGHCSRSSVDGDLDATAFEDDLSVVALEDFSRFRERRPRIGSDL